MAVALLMAAAGLVGIILGAGGVGIEDTGERIGATVVGAVALLGPAGLVMQVRRPAVGGALAVLGSCAAVLLNAWAILPILLLPATIVVAFMRTKRLTKAHQGRLASEGM